MGNLKIGLENCGNNPMFTLYKMIEKNYKKGSEFLFESVVHLFSGKDIHFPSKLDSWFEEQKIIQSYKILTYDCPGLTQMTKYRSLSEQFNKSVQAIDMNKIIESIRVKRLIVLYTDGENTYLCHPKWKTYQKISHAATSILPDPKNCTMIPEDSDTV